MNDRVLQRIMYVDDEPDVRKVAKISLEKVGRFDLCLCSAGQEALEKIGGFGPDLIILDVMMPNMDGPATLQALRGIETFASTPVIFITAKAQPAEVQHYRDLGAVDVILKPFHPMKLPDQLRAVWQALP